MGAVSRAKGIVDIEVGKRSQLTAKAGVVFFFFRPETQVFKQHDLAGLQRGGQCAGALPRHVLRQLDGLVQKLAQARGDRAQRIFGVDLALGPAEMGTQNDGRPLGQKVADGGQGRRDAGLVGDDAVLQGDIEVTAQQHLFAGNSNVGDRFFVQAHKDSSL